VEVGGVAISMDCPVLFSSLLVKLLFSKKLVVMLGELLLEVEILLVRRFGLLLE
jgi:hypothetical protein